MRLEVDAGGQRLALEVEPTMLTDAEAFFAKMDRDMDGGWRMGPEWVERPDRVQRCQIAADKLLGALSTANENLALLMAGYILKRLPHVSGVQIDTAGEPLSTAFTFTSVAPTAQVAAPSSPRLGRLEAMERAGKEVGQVFRVGKSYRFATLEAARNQWIESPLFETESEANASRLQAVKRRFDELAGAPSPSEASPGSGTAPQSDPTA
jgi:hypothetical protein